MDVKKYDKNGKELAIRFGLGGIKAVGIGMIEEMINNRDQGGRFKDIYDFSERSGLKAMNKKTIEALAKSGAFDSIHPNRNQIAESTEIICKYAVAKDNERSSNQMNLFGASATNEKPALKTATEWTQEQKLQEEFKAFGFFVNEHPIDDFLDALKKRGVVLSENLDDMVDGNIIKLAGVVAYSKHKSGPKGRYAYLTMSDPFGIYETSIFDEALITTSRDIMLDGSSLVVECLVKKDQGGSRLLVKSLQKMEDFIKSNSPKKEAYQDIKQQEKRTEFDWKQKSKQKATQKDGERNDILVEELSYKKKINDLKNKKIFTQVNIQINNRDNILRLKSFLSQKFAPIQFDNFTKVFFLVENQKIELADKYLLDENDVEKIKSISLVEVFN